MAMRMPVEAVHTFTANEAPVSEARPDCSPEISRLAPWGVRVGPGGVHPEVFLILSVQSTVRRRQGDYADLRHAPNGLRPALVPNGRRKWSSATTACSSLFAAGILLHLWLRRGKEVAIHCHRRCRISKAASAKTKNPAGAGFLAGRSGVIRTLDPHVPNVVRYQTALHSVTSGASIEQPIWLHKRQISKIRGNF